MSTLFRLICFPVKKNYIHITWQGHSLVCFAELAFNYVMYTHTGATIVTMKNNINTHFQIKHSGLNVVFMCIYYYIYRAGLLLADQKVDSCNQCRKLNNLCHV